MHDAMAEQGLSEEWRRSSGSIWSARRSRCRTSRTSSPRTPSTSEQRYVRDAHRRRAGGARRHLPDLPALVRRQRRRRHRRPARGHRAPATTCADLGVDAIWLSPVLHARRRPTPATTSPTTATSTRCFGTLADVDALIARGPRPRHPGHRRPGAQPHLQRAPVVPGGAGRRARRRPRATATSSARAGATTARRRPTTGSVFGGPRWTRVRDAGRHARGSGTCTCSTRPSPTSTGTTPRSATSSATSCASGSTAASTASASTSRTAWSRSRGCPTSPPRAGRSRPSMVDADARCPFWDQDGVHDIYRDWRDVADEYDGDRALLRRGLGANARAPGPVPAPRRDAPGVQLPPSSRPWDAAELRDVDRRVPRATPPVGAPTHVGAVEPRRGAARPRLALPGENADDGIDLRSPELSRRAARRATPFSCSPARLGLPLPGRGARPARGHATCRTRRVRTRPGSAAAADGTAVTDAASPMPWTATRRPTGSARRGASWLPQPESWADLSVDRQTGVEGSTLEMYRAALRIRRVANRRSATGRSSG